MTFTFNLSRPFFTVATVFIILLTFASCKKEPADTKEENKLPQLGTCKPVPASGRLTIESKEKFSFQTSGGGSIDVNLKNAIIIKHKDYAGFKIEFWGDFENEELNISGNHENLNGKHVKDWKGYRRSLIFPDGTKLTMVTSGVHQSLISIAIYDGQEVHCFNTSCKTLEYSASRSPFRQVLDDQEADGETSTFEITENGLTWKSIYTEDEPGNKENDEYKLGELLRDDPTRVNDFYDDPRLGHT